VGFLGAGAVFRSGRIVTGLTTAAGIWATAAAGLVFGLGYFVFGISVTFMIFLLLWIQSYMEKRNLHASEWVNYRIYVDATDGKGPIVLNEIVQDWGHQVEEVEKPNQSENLVIWQVRLCPHHRPHQRSRPCQPLRAQPSVEREGRADEDSMTTVLSAEC
jgi:uncharacterized membrane protein YhiD involved in acid resistance